MFLSYCWSNSHAAVKLGTREQEGSLGATDPRDIKNKFEENGLSCWIDIQESGKVKKNAVKTLFLLSDCDCDIGSK